MRKVVPSRLVPPDCLFLPKQFRGGGGGGGGVGGGGRYYWFCQFLAEPKAQTFSFCPHNLPPPPPPQYSVRVNQVVDERKGRGWVADSQKRKMQISKENFFPVPLGRNRKEIAAQWFQDLAGPKPLAQLTKKVPVFNKKEEIFDNLCEKDVPISRAAWYIKVCAFVLLAARTF